MNARRLASSAVFLTAALDLGVWIGTIFLGLQIESEVGRGLASLFMGGLLAGLGWLIARGNKLALTLAVALSLFDVVTGVCLSTGTGGYGGIANAIRAVLLVLMVGSVWSGRKPSQKRPSANLADESPTSDALRGGPEGKTTEPEIAAPELTTSPKAVPIRRPSDPIRRRFGIAIVGLFALLGCGLASLIWETLFRCDPRLAWDMQLGCVIRPDPTPGPFPIERVRQLTFDSNYYEQLKWSPAGNYLLAMRCEIIQRQAACYDGQQPVLIDLISGEVSDLDFSWYPTTASSIQFHSYLWSSDGKKILLDFIEVFLATPVPSEVPTYLGNREYVPHRIVLNLTTKDYVEIKTGEVWPIAWLDRQGLIFGFRRGEYDPESRNSIDSFGWYDYEADRWQEEMKLNSDYYGNTLTLSPDQSTVLLGRDRSNSSCLGQVLVYRLGDDPDGFTDIRGACFPAYSTDGSRIAYSILSEGDVWPYGVWIAEADGQNLQPAFTIQEPESTSSIAWSPDGSQIAFTYGYHLNAIYIIDVPPHQGS